MRRTKSFTVLVLLIGITVLTYAAASRSPRFGGYYGTDSGNTRPPVSAFINTAAGYGHITGGPMAGYVDYFDYYNNTYYTGIDYWEFAYVCASGGVWKFMVNDGWVDLNDPAFGSGPDQGWGDYHLNWAAFYVGSFLASPLEVEDWWSVWMADNPYDVMDGVHMILGFRTNAYVSPAVSVSTHYADYICSGGEILLKWFHAVWYYSFCQTTSYDKASAVFSPGCQHDTLSSFCTDPPPYTLYCWYY
jgi:hypothetical protein